MAASGSAVAYAAAAPTPAAPVTDKPRAWLPGLDIGRAFFVVAVVGWHTQAFGTADVLDVRERGTAFPVDVPGVVYFNVLLLAVPFFLTASLVLYASGREGRPERFRPRLVRLAWLTAFWLGLWQLTTDAGTLSLGRAPHYLLSGGGSIFYFLVELLALTVLMEVVVRAGLLRRPGLNAALLVLALLPPLVAGTLADRLPGDEVYLTYWSPLNFLVFPFLAIAVLQLKDRVELTPRRVVAALAAYVAVATAEWGLMVVGRGFSVDNTVLPPYGRPSLVLGTGLVLLLLLGVRRTAPAPVRWLSGLSLGIYCVHPFLLVNGAAVFEGLWTDIQPVAWLRFLVVFTLATAIAYPLRRGLAT